MGFKHVLDMIKEYGVLKCVGRVLYDPLYQIAAPIYKGFLSKTTVVDPKKVLFVSSPAFSDNSWFLYEYLHSNLDDSYHFVWLAGENDRIRPLRDRTRVVYQWTFFCPKKAAYKSLKEIATSKYIFFTHGSPNKWIAPREGQVIVNLWHGCGLKHVEKRERPMAETEPFDIGLVPGDLFIKTKSLFWGCDESKIMPVGYPRYDCLLRDDVKTEQWVRELKGKNKIVVWMPTFRKTRKHEYPEDEIHSAFDLPLLQDLEQLSKLDRFCRERDILLCIKRHFLQLAYSAENQKYTNIVFLSQEHFSNRDMDLYAFLHYTDALISDYSSVAIDFLLLDKPIAYSLDDFEEYNRTRGFVVDNPLDFMPGHHLYNYEDMLQFLQDVAENKDPFREKRQELMPLVHNPCSNYCERVWQSVKDMEISR